MPPAAYQLRQRVIEIHLHCLEEMRYGDGSVRAEMGGNATLLSGDGNLRGGEDNEATVAKRRASSETW